MQISISPDNKIEKGRVTNVQTQLITLPYLVELDQEVDKSL
jgi:hypothetical protein